MNAQGMRVLDGLKKAEQELEDAVGELESAERLHGMAQRRLEAWRMLEWFRESQRISDGRMDG